MKFYLETGIPGECISWDDAAVFANTAAETAAFETSYYWMRIESPPVNAVEFKLKIGDEFVPISPQYYPGRVEIGKTQFFESAAGKTDLTVFGFDQDGHELFSVTRSIYVIPSKIGQANYQRMVNDLNAVCHALLNDLLGKSKHGKVWNRFRKRSFRSHEEELIAIRRMWKQFSVDLRMIAAGPQGYLARKNVVILPHGKNAANYRTQRRILQRCSPGSSYLDKQLSSRLEYSLDTVEHRLLKKFIKILLLRVSACLKGINNSIRELQTNGVFRKQSFGGNKSLYELEDLPRIVRLESRKREAGTLLNSIEQQLDASFWDGVSEELFVPGPDRFMANRYYKHAALCIFQFLQNGFYWDDSSSLDFTTKKTSRIYEQWVLINLVNAFEACGLTVTSWEQIINDALNSQFNMDFQRGTQFLCSLSPKYTLSIRYEPWIIPRPDKEKFPEATLFHQDRGNSYWSPDIVLELMECEAGTKQTKYAIAIDCKYSKQIAEEQKHNTEKYLRIRSTVSGEQVVRQLWLFHVGKDDAHNEIIPGDEFYCFSRDAGIRFREGNYDFDAIQEQISGYVIAKPDLNESSRQASLDDVPEVFREFAEGTIAFFKMHFGI